LALRWSNVDFDGGAIAIRRRRQWPKGEDGVRRPKFYPPKTKAGRRIVPAPPELIHALKQWFLQTHFKQPNDLIFPTGTGEPHYNRNTGKMLAPLRTRAKLRHSTMHSLRHSYASSPLREGASLARWRSTWNTRRPW
jgi:integrase